MKQVSPLRKWANTYDGAIAFLAEVISEADGKSRSLSWVCDVLAHRRFLTYEAARAVSKQTSIPIKDLRWRRINEPRLVDDE